LNRWDERPVSRAELEAALARPRDPEADRALLDLVRWFTGRYDAAGRLAYVRRAYARWAATRGAALR
jgi:hypothetical protein